MLAIVDINKKTMSDVIPDVIVQNIWKEANDLTGDEISISHVVTVLEVSVKMKVLEQVKHNNPTFDRQKCQEIVMTAFEKNKNKSPWSEVGQLSIADSVYDNILSYSENQGV